MRSNGSGSDPCDHDDIAEAAAIADRADEKDRDQQNNGR
jgi:hypothetical protein